MLQLKEIPVYTFKKHAIKYIMLRVNYTMDTNDYLQNPMYFLSGVNKWVGGEESFQIFLSKKSENQQHEIPQEISKWEKKSLYLVFQEVNKPLLQSQNKRKYNKK